MKFQKALELRRDHRGQPGLSRVRRDQLESSVRQTLEVANRDGVDFLGWHKMIEIGTTFTVQTTLAVARPSQDSRLVGSGHTQMCTVDAFQLWAWDSFTANGLELVGHALKRPGLQKLTMNWTLNISPFHMHEPKNLSQNPSPTK